jgi:hypothetical protein
MAKAFLTNVNLKTNQLQYAALHPVSSAPTGLTAVAGQIYYNTSDNLLYTYNGSAWSPVNGGVIVGATTFYGKTTFAGTANQITATASGTSPNGTVTFSLPSAITFPGTITVQSGNATSLGGTLTVSGGLTTLSASTTSGASLNIPSGTAPTSPAVGDIWLVQATGLLARYGATPGTHTLADLDSVQTLTNKTLTSPVISTITNTGTLTLPTSTDTLVGKATTDVFTNKTFDTAGTGNVLKINGTTVSAVTGSGSVVLATSPSLTTPSLGVATATSINGLAISTSTGTLTIANGSTLATSGANSITLTSTGATNVTLPTTGTLVNTAVSSLTSLGTISTALTGFVSASAGVLSASSTISGGSISGNISGSAANVTGIVALANGGTNSNLTATAGGIVYSTASGMAISTAGTSGYVLTSAGTSAPTWTQASSTNVNSAIVQRDSSGNIAVSQVTVTADPSQALQVATKQYVDNIASGINAHAAVVTATTANLTATYSNGTSGVGATLTNSGTLAALVIDGVTPIVGDRILVKNQSTTFQNGIYTVTNVGSGSVAWILTRATDYDNSTPGEVEAGDMVYVVAPAAEITGTPTNQGTGWIMNAPGVITVGTSAITFAQSSGSGTVTAGNGISVTGNSVAVSLGSAFDNTTGTGTSGLSLSGGTLQVRLSSTGGLTSSTAGIAINTPGTGLTLSGNAISYATGTTTQTGTGVSGGAYTYATQKQVATITGDSTTSSFTVNHNLATRDVMVRVYQTSATPDTQYGDVEVDITRATTGTITVAFATAPATGITYNVVMVG